MTCCRAGSFIYLRSTLARENMKVTAVQERAPNDPLRHPLNPLILYQRQQ